MRRIPPLSVISSSEDDLLQLLLPRLNTMLRHGTTLADCKSGYGLVTEHELKMLRVLQRAKKETPLTIVMNLLAAHSVPTGYTPEEATEMIVTEMIPKALELKKKGELDVELIDISLFRAACTFITLFVKTASTMLPKQSASCRRVKKVV